MNSERVNRYLVRALVALQAILIVTGGAVRLTESGLGCPTWPECSGDSYTPVPGQAEGALHAWIEFGNRLLTFVIALASLAVVLALRKRRDLRLLSLAQVAGILGQGVLGGITVLTDLNPIAVGSHFTLSIILLAGALQLLYRLDAPSHRVESSINVHTLLTFVVIVLGTLVTGAGPHAGDVSAPRLNVHIPTITAIHGFAVVALIAYSLFLLITKREYARALSIFLIVSLAQGVLGYAQYLLTVPALLVAIHMTGAALTWIAAWRIRLISHPQEEK